MKLKRSNWVKIVDRLIGKTVPPHPPGRSPGSRGEAPAAKPGGGGTGGPTAPRHVQRETPCSENSKVFDFWPFLC